MSSDPYDDKLDRLIAKEIVLKKFNQILADGERYKIDLKNLTTENNDFEVEKIFSNDKWFESLDCYITKTKIEKYFSYENKNNNLLYLGVEKFGFDGNAMIIEGKNIYDYFLTTEEGQYSFNNPIKKYSNFIQKDTFRCIAPKSKLKPYIFKYGEKIGVKPNILENYWRRNICNYAVSKEILNNKEIIFLLFNNNDSYIPGNKNFYNYSQYIVKKEDILKYINLNIDKDYILIPVKLVHQLAL